MSRLFDSQAIEKNENRFPLPKNEDCPFAAIRFILMLREHLGFFEINPSNITEIRNVGYDRFFLDRMNGITEIGTEEFYNLASAGLVGLTTEFVVYHNFYDRLTACARSRLSNLLLESASTCASKNDSPIACPL